MDNHFRVSRRGLVNLLHASQIRQIAEYPNDTSAYAQRFARETANMEVLSALALADFYSPEAESEIVFSLARDVDPTSINSYEELVESFETNTHIDCRIIAGDNTFDFQLKRYPFPHREYTPHAFLDWLQQDVLAHYGDMSGTRLCIVLQPSGTYEEGPMDIGEIARGVQDLVAQITFEEIVLIYNDRMQYFALLKLHPETHRYLIPLEWGLARFRGDV